MGGLLDLGQHGLEDVGGVAHHRQVHLDVLVDLAGVDVDLDDGGLFGEGAGFQGHTVGEPGADGHHHVGLAHRAVGGVAAVHADHPQAEGVIVGHHAGAHQGVGGGDAGLVDQVPQGLAAGSAADAAAKVDHRPLGAVDDVGGPGHFLFVKGGDGADGLGLPGGELALVGGDILGDIHQHRALAAALGDAEGGPHGVGQVLHTADGEVVLGDGHGDALDVGLLEAVPAQQVGGNVAGEGHHGDAVHIGGGDAGDQVGGARAAGGQHHAGAAGGAGIAVRRVGRALLVGGQHMGDAVGILVQFIVEVEHCAPRVAEDGIDPLLAQHLHENLRTVEQHSFPSSFFLTKHRLGPKA